ncbi:hypothetical protein BDR22DRAFT_877075 [Usnea florida]
MKLTSHSSKVMQNPYIAQNSPHLKFLCTLQLQHLIWSIRLGCRLYPSIQTQSAEPFRLTDVGIGNGSATFTLLWFNRQAKSGT